MNIVPIVFSFDNNLVMPACVCISSLMMNAKEDTFYDIFILHSASENLNKSDLDRIPEFYKNCRIQYREVGNEFDGAFEIRGITTPAYYRLLIPEIIPEYDKVIYSDVDVIFRDDLYHFYDIDLSDYYFAGVDVGLFLRPDIYDYAKNVIKIDVSKGYYYSGNMVINSKKIIEYNIVVKFKQLGKNKYKFQDLDILNIVCNGFIKRLTPEFCLTNYFYILCHTQRNKVEELYPKNVINNILNRGIVHYNGAKPWNTMCYNQDIWWGCYRKSPFYDENFVYQYYDNCVKEYEKRTFYKRFKHLLSYLKGLIK